MRSTAFFVNGGAGRVICSIPAFEKYKEEHPEDDFIIVAEGGTDFFKGHPDLYPRVYDNWHKDLFRSHIQMRNVVTTEPYRIWEYYNQKCNLTQAFDIQINNKGIRNLPKPTIYLSKEELLTGRQLISEVKKKIKKDKVIVIQPFGRAIDYIDETLIDKSGRSFELKDLKKIVKKLQEKNFAIIMMSEFKVDFSEDKLKDELAMPEGVNLRQWAAVIKYADHFLGCDSVGQHLSYAMEVPSTIVTGSTYPVNISYPDCKYFEIFDMGEVHREYSPIRITVDERIDRGNENIMSMNDEIIGLLVNNIIGVKE